MASYTATITNPFTTDAGQGIWHTGPTMQAYGTVTFTRSDIDSKVLTYSGTIGNRGLYLDIIYPYEVTGIIEYNGVPVCPEFTISTVSGNGQGSVNISGSFELTEPGNVIIYNYCNGGGTHSCDRPEDYSKTAIGSYNILEELPYDPYVPMGFPDYKKAGDTNGTNWMPRYDAIYAVKKSGTWETQNTDSSIIGYYKSSGVWNTY